MRVGHRIVTTMLSVGMLAIAGGLLVTGVNSHADAAGSITFSQLGADIDGEASDSVEPVAMSADGTRVAIGAPFNGSSRGRVRIYEWDSINNEWDQLGNHIDGAATQDKFGFSVGMSADGTRVVIGARQHDNWRGHVRIYEWDSVNNEWDQLGTDIDGEATQDQFGFSVGMSADGGRVVIGAPINGNSKGHVRIFDWNGSAWIQKGDDIDGEAVADLSGRSVAISADGTHVVIGAYKNDPDSDGDSEGHVRIFGWNGSAWTQVGADIDGEAAGDESGWSVAISADGTRVVIGAPRNDGNGDSSGHVRIYDWNGTSWTQVGADIDGEAAGDESGLFVSITSDGTRIAIGTYLNGGNGARSGHVRIYDWNGTSWTQVGADIDGEAAGDESGYVALSANGKRVAIAAPSNGGGGAWSGHVRIFSTPRKPSAPTITSVSGGNQSLSIAFTAGDDGDSPISNYLYSTDGTTYTPLNPAATTSPIIITGLTNGTTYSVTLKAVNALGESVASNSVNGAPVATSVTTTTPTTTVKKTTQLPATGNQSSTMVLLAGLLVASGLIVLNRRRFVR